VNPPEEPSGVATNSARHPDRLERMLKAADPATSGIVATPGIEAALDEIGAAIVTPLTPICAGATPAVDHAAARTGPDRGCRDVNRGRRGGRYQAAQRPHRPVHDRLTGEGRAGRAR
jgi:hypothetical protein